jgi:hypothetical protein
MGSRESKSEALTKQVRAQRKKACQALHEPEAPDGVRDGSDDSLVLRI